MPVGSWQFAVAHKGHVGKDAGPVVVAERQTADAGDVALAGAGSVRGTVAAADGRKLRIALVEHRRVGETAWGDRVPASGGKFRIPNLSAGAALPEGRVSLIDADNLIGSLEARALWGRYGL